MWNPFKTQLPHNTVYVPVADPVGNDPNDVVLLANTVELDDADYADVLVSPLRGNLDDLDPAWHPEYAGAFVRELVYTPGQTYHYTDAGVVDPNPSLPGTVELNIAHGPVDGNAMDAFQTGNRQQLMSVPPGANGPVVGGPDYAQTVSDAYFQQAFIGISNEAATAAMVAAI